MYLIGNLTKFSFTFIYFRYVTYHMCDKYTFCSNGDSCNGLTPDIYVMIETIVSIMTTRVVEISLKLIFLGSALPAEPSLNPLINHSLTLLPKHYPSYPPPQLTHFTHYPNSPHSHNFLS